MSRTVKWEHATDSWHTGHKIERQARPAGRMLAIVTAELDAESDEWPTQHDFVVGGVVRPEITNTAEWLAALGIGA